MSSRRELVHHLARTRKLAIRYALRATGVLLGLCTLAVLVGLVWHTLSEGDTPMAAIVLIITPPFMFVMISVFYLWIPYFINSNRSRRMESLIQTESHRILWIYTQHTVSWRFHGVTAHAVCLGLDSGQIMKAYISEDAEERFMTLAAEIYYKALLGFDEGRKEEFERRVKTHRSQLGQ